MNEDTRPLKDSALLTEVTRALVCRPDHVRVRCEDLPEGPYILHLDVHPEDKGRVIGRDGRIISALRRLFSAVGALDGRQLIVEIDD